MPAKRKASKVGRIIPALTARTQFGQILRRVQENRERFVVGRRGRPQALILGIEEYLERFVKPNPALAAVQHEAKALGLDTLTLKDINREIRACRRERQRANAKRRS